MITPEQFTTNFPAFSNPTAYPTEQIQFWLTQGYSQLNACSLGNQLDYAAQLFAAHNLTLLRSANQGAESGSGGQSAGMLAAKAVGGASAGYDTAATAQEGAGVYNATVYGQLLWPLLRGSQAGPKYSPGGDPFFRAPILPLGGLNGFGWY